MSQQSLNLPHILRLGLELGLGIERALPAAHTDHQQRLLDALNPFGAVFPGEPEAHTEREHWRNGSSAVPTAGARGWTLTITRSGLPAGVRDALWTIAIGLADVRGADWWRTRLGRADRARAAGWDDDSCADRLPTTDGEASDSIAEALCKSGVALLSAGGHQLWQGLAPEERESVADLLPEVTRVWGWPCAGGREPATGALRFGEAGERLLGPDWTNISPDYNQTPTRDGSANDTVLATYTPPGGTPYRVFCRDCVPSDAGLPTVCPRAEPPAIQGVARTDFLAWVEEQFREATYITGEETVHWVGQHCGHCSCRIVRPNGVPVPVGRDDLRDLHRAVGELLRFVRERYGRVLAPHEASELDRLAQNAVGLAPCAGGLPPAPPLSPASPVHYGVAGVPVVMSADGIAPCADPARVWESRWETVRSAAARKLEAMDQAFLVPATPFPIPPTIPDELRNLPAGTSEPDAKAYRALVEAVATAAELFHSAPEPTCDFQESLDYLAGRRKTLPNPDNFIDPLVGEADLVCRHVGEARRTYRAIEARLATHAGSGGCAFQLALNAIRGVTDIAEDVLGVFRPPEYTLHEPPQGKSAPPTGYSYRPNIAPERVQHALRRCTPFDPGKLLLPVREQVMRVAAVLGSVQINKLTETNAAPPRSRGEKRDLANGKMIALLEDDERCRAWPARKWARYLGCGPTTVKQTLAWRMITKDRGGNRPPRKDRHSK